MWKMTVNEMQYFEDDDDDFFADAFRSISDLESLSSKCARAKESSQNGCTKDNDNLEICDSPTDVIPSSYPRTIDINENIDSSIIYNCVRNDKVEFISANDSTAIQHVTKSDTHETTINHRFTPGVPPKRKKRIFCGPAGLFTDEELEALYSRHNTEPDTKRLSTEEFDSQDITSSQISVEQLYRASSWQKLQEHVSSNSSLLSIAECFSIQRVRNEASKKRLPKHIIVPLLCVYIKEFNPEEPIFKFMDDTEEINGSISKEILESYRHYFKSGTSLILKKVAFMCNIMILGRSNLVSLFLEDGSVQHEQEWTVEEEEYDELSRQALLPCDIICPVTPKCQKKEMRVESTLSVQRKNLPDTQSFSCSPSSSENVNKNNDQNSSEINIFTGPILETGVTDGSVQHEQDWEEVESDAVTSKYQKKENAPISVQSKVCNNLSPSFSCSPSSENINNHQNLSPEANILTDPILETDAMDDFDDLLGTLDEKSFLEDF